MSLSKFYFLKNVIYLYSHLQNKNLHPELQIKGDHSRCEENCLAKQAVCQERLISDSVENLVSLLGC